MNKYFIYTSPTPAYSGGKPPKTLDIPVQTGNDANPAVDDRFLVASGKEKKSVVPMPYWN